MRQLFTQKKFLKKVIKMEINIGNIVLEDELNFGNIKLDTVKVYPELENIQITPSKEEQTIIGIFQANFDALISKSQDKLNSLKSLKICYLNRLFPIGGGRYRLYA